MRKLKLFFACLLMAVLSIGQVWATSATWTLVESEPSDWSGEYLIVYGTKCFNGSLSASLDQHQGVDVTINNNSISLDDSYAMIVAKSGTKYSLQTAAGCYVGRNGNSNGMDANTTWSTNYTVTFSNWNSTNKTVQIKGNGGRALGNNSGPWRFYANSNAYTNLKLFRKAGGSSNPTLSLKQGNVEIETLAIPVAGATNQTLTVAYANIKSGTTPGAPTLAYYSNAACTSTTSKPSWLTSVTATNGTTITYSAAANTTDAARTPVWMVVSNTVKNTSNANATVTDTLKFTQAAPTGTFVKFTGETIPNGYYVICSGTTTNAMKSKATSAPRLENATVTIANSKTITNPDDSVVWKLENLTGTDAGYFTLYNEETEKYAAFTSANGNATLLAEVTNYAKFKHTANTSYDFENKGKTGKVLRYNSGYGFASYGTGTGAVLTLYKKALPFALTINSSIANGSVGASDGSTAISSGSNVLSGTEVTLSNTPADGYKLTAYDIYKTGESATKVTVTNGKFTMPDYAVTVSASFEAAKTLSSISLSGTHRTEFWQGEAFNSTGLVVTAHYDDNSSATVTPTSVSSPTMTSAGEKTITVSYTEGGTTKEETYDITVNALPTEANPGSVADMIDIYNKLGNTSNMYVIGTIYKINGFYSEKYISYWITDSYDADEEPNHTNEFELYNGLDFEGHDFTAQTDLETGQEVVVKGNLTRFGSTAPYTYEFGANNIIISRPKVLKSIALSGSYPTAFTQGDEFSSEGLVVTASYNYGDPTGVTPTSITGYNMSATGNQTVTVSYTEGGVTKTATYGISVAAPDLCEHKATISKGAEVNGTFSLSVSGEQCLDELEGYKTSTVLTATPAEHYHLSEVTATVGTVGVISENSCTISNITANTTITAVFAEDDKVTIKFDKGTESATGVVPTDVADKYAGQSVTLPANPFTYTGSPIKVFGGWKHSLTNEVKQPGSYTITAADAAEDNITFTAVWNDLSPWATVYTSNVTLSTTGGTSASAAKVKFYGEEGDGYDAIKAGTSGNSGAVKVTVPAQATKLHFHAYGWSSESIGLTVTAPTGVTVSPSTEISINSNAGLTGNTPFTLAEGSDPKTDAYYVVALSGNAEETTLTFTATSGKRFVLFGVNQEGGVEPELDHITITGELANKDYELGDEVDKTGLTVRAYYTLAGVAHHNEDVTSDVVWSNDPLTGGQTSVDVTATYGGKSDTKACAINAVVVPTPQIILSESALEFSGKQYGAIASQTFNVTLKNVAAATVALSGDDAAKFSVDPTALTANGTVTVSVVNAAVAGSFSATVTVSDNASAATAQTVALTLTLTADEAPAWDAEWIPATELYDGMPILITGVNSTTSKIYAVGAQNSNNRAAVEASVDGNGVLTPGTGTKQFTLEVVDAENNQYAIKTSDGKYLYAAGSGSGKNYLRSQDENDANGVWTLTVESATANGSNTNKYMKFNTSGMFSCYSSGQTAIKLYTPKTYTRNVSGNYGTICLPNGGVLTNGALYEIAEMDYQDNKPYKIYFDEVEGGVMEAGKPYIFKPNDGETTLRVVYTDAADAAEGNYNGLYGKYSKTPLAKNNGNYILKNNQYYYVNSNNVYCEANRAYIVLAEVPAYDPGKPAYGRRRIALNVNNEQVATDIDALNASENPVKVMIDGQLFILRGEKMYDATGRLVK